MAEAKSRRDQIAVIIKEAFSIRKELSFKELVDRFNVSPCSISQDLTFLLENQLISEEQYGYIKRSCASKREPADVERAVKEQKMPREQIIANFKFKHAKDMFRYFREYCDFSNEEILYLKSEEASVLHAVGSTREIVKKYLNDVFQERDGKPFAKKTLLLSDFNGKKLLHRDIGINSLGFHIKHLIEQNLLTPEIINFYKACNSRNLKSM